MKELHVFPQPHWSTIPARSICAMKKLADQVLERIRKRATFVEDKLDARKLFCSPHFLLKFSAQKFA
jgi:hypothetical protein